MEVIFFIMDMIKTLSALGMSSGTSLDGVDIALIKTDGVDVYDFGRSMSVPYEDGLREKIRSILGKRAESPELTAEIKNVEEELTRFHAEIVKDFMASGEEKIDVIGFEGHNICHDPKNHFTSHIGDGNLLAELTGIKVVNHFANADIRAGGQGAPLVPVYYQALCGDMGKPLAVVNIGGISSLTWIGSIGELVAFDVGPGNAAINDWVLKHGGMHMDYNGKLAITGHVNEQIVASMMRHKFFAQYPPKAVDRGIFNEKLEHLEGLNVADGAATATAFIAEAIAYSLLLYLPEIPNNLIICGGGAKNPTLIRFLRQRLPDINIKTAAEEGFDANALEAQAFAYMAVRRLYHLPITFPATTGVAEPMVGGELHEYVKL